MDLPTLSGYRSATEYCFSEEHTDAIVRTAAYHRKDFDLSVIWFSPRQHVDINRSISSPFQRISNVGLGFLDRLPLEILHETLPYLDMYSLFRFRQINLRSRQAVDSLKQYETVASHGLNLLCALLRTGLATSISLLDFYDALCTKACALCGEFGGFISLLTWKRCCFKCLQCAPQIQVQTLSALRKQLHLTKVESNRLNSFKTLPGKYSMDESMRKSRIAIASVQQALSICRRQTHVSAQAQSSSVTCDQEFNFMGSCALPYFDRTTRRAEHGMSCLGCQLALEKYIIGARGDKWAFEARDKVFAQDGFIKHFRWCEQAQLLWRTSNEGSIRPPELPVAARRGGYLNNRG